MTTDPTLFCLISLIVLGIIGLMFTEDPNARRSHRPPEHPPGWKNRKKTK